MLVIKVWKIIYANALSFVHTQLFFCIRTCEIGWNQHTYFMTCTAYARDFSLVYIGNANDTSALVMCRSATIPFVHTSNQHRRSWKWATHITIFITIPYIWYGRDDTFDKSTKVSPKKYKRNRHTQAKRKAPESCLAKRDGREKKEYPKRAHTEKEDEPSQTETGQ